MKCQNRGGHFNEAFHRTECLYSVKMCMCECVHAQQYWISVNIFLLLQTKLLLSADALCSCRSQIHFVCNAYFQRGFSRLLQVVFS